MKNTFVIAGRILADLSTAEIPSGQLAVFCHGYKGYKDWGAWNLVADEFTKQGIDFLKFNFSLNGGTLEDPIDFPDLDAFGRNTYSQELCDVKDVIEYVGVHYPNKEIILIGHSRGGGIATLAAAQHAAVDYLITWAGVCDFKRRFPAGEELKQWRKNGVRHILNGRTKQKMPHFFTFYEDFVSNEADLDILAWTQKINVPHLVIHGTEDAAVTIEEAQELSAANTDAQTFFLTTNHTFDSKHPWEEKQLPQSLQAVVDQTIKFVK